jgi:hypothetical protein
MADVVRSDGTLPLPNHAEAGTDFTHADLQLHNVDRSGWSKEVRVYLNNDEAGEDTTTDPESGYAGSLYVFGHGECYGEEGHCDVESRRKHPYDYRLPHPLEPSMMSIEVTDALKRLRDSGATEVSVTLVPITYPGPKLLEDEVPDELKLDSISLVTYETGFSTVQDEAVEAEAVGAHA